MRIPWTLTIAAVLAALLPAGGELPAQEADEHHGHRHDATVSHGFEDVEHWSRVFDDPERDAWQRPEEVLRFLRVAEGQTVVDLGAGTGYFTLRLARAVGRSGTVLAVDIEPTLLEHLRKRAEEAGFSRVRTVLADPDDPKLPSNAVDLILVVNTWHHINDRIRYLGRLAESLREGGGVAVVDYREGKIPMGPPPGHKMTHDEVVEEFAEAGWRLEREGEMLPYQYLLLFTPPERRETRETVGRQRR